MNFDHWDNRWIDCPEDYLPVCSHKNLVMVDDHDGYRTKYCVKCDFAIDIFPVF